jgi:methylmalonyl-CoA/ethylmalonyl-CoA epimerase
MKKKGFRLIDKAPRPGSRGTTVFFVHPKSQEETPFGILIEIVEDPAAVKDSKSEKAEQHAG